jgi:tetratricopeptide (TPR) repeat protein
MISEVHYDDETLIAMVESGDAAAAMRRDPHLTACALCREALEQYRAVVDVLGTDAAWELHELRDEPRAETIATLRAFASNIEREDHDAELIVPLLLAGERETWMPRLAEHPEWRTAGVVRKLVADAYAALNRMPPDAVEMMTIATEIADHLDPARYSKDAIGRTRGDAWRERGYAWFYVGRYSEALRACDVASEALAECALAEHEQARVDVVRALTLREIDRLDEAVTLSRRAMRVFGAQGDYKRLVAAGVTVAQIKFSAQDFRTALQHLQELWQSYSGVLDAESRGVLAANLGYCHRELSNFDEAIEHYEIAAPLFARTSPTEGARIRWNVAGIVFATGRYAEAQRRLTAIRDEFDRLGLEAAATVVRLELAELLIVQNAFEEAEQLCREIISRFESAGMQYSANALTAVSYLHEAVNARAATAKLARKVRDYVSRLPDEPNLLFAPPLL